MIEQVLKDKFVDLLLCFPSETICSVKNSGFVVPYFFFGFCEQHKSHENADQVYNNKKVTLEFIIDFTSLCMT